MIRYNKGIQLHTNTNGTHRLTTDMGQSWHMTGVKEQNPMTVWLQAYHSKLREYQRDYIQLIHQAFNPEYKLHPIDLYWVYQQGRGYEDQTGGVAFARISTHNTWVLMTPQHTWIIENQYENFWFYTQDGIGPVTETEAQDAIWEWRDSMLGITPRLKKKYTDLDYERKGNAP